MRNTEAWQPTKFVMTAEGLRGSRDTKYLSLGSRYIGDIQARTYQRILTAHAAGRLLDLGCGHVPLYQAYRDLVNDVICLDWESSLHKNAFLDKTTDLNGDLPFPPETFDTVLMTDVLEHLPEPATVVRRLSALLREEGKLILSVPFMYWLHEQPYDYYRYTEHALRHFCTLAGLHVVELSPYGGLPEILFDLTSKGISSLPHGLANLLRPVHYMMPLLSNMGPVREVSKKTQSLFPLGYALVAQRPKNPARTSKIVI